MAFPDPVALTVAYLAPIVDPTPVSSRVPDPRPAQFVQVRRVGGTPQPPVQDRARLDVRCWAPEEPDAMDLALTVRAAVWALSGTTLLGGVPVYSIDELLSPRQDDDDLTGTPRVWATYTLTVRADDVIQPAPSILT